MQYNTQKNILPGQVTEFRGEYFEAQKRSKLIPCRAQCDCRLPIYAQNKAACSGFCYRWNNGDEIVFKKVEKVADDDCLIETEFMKACREFNSGAPDTSTAQEVRDLENRLRKAKAKLRDMEYEKYFNEHPAKKGGDDAEAVQS
jgi:hypothetical protein